MVCLKTYSRDQLVALRGDVTLSRCVRKVIFSHQLWLPAYARDLRNFHGSIHKYGRIVRRRNSNHCNQHLTQNESNPHGSTSIGLLNAQSLNNKFAAVCERISADRLSLCAVVETWHDGVDSPSLIGTAPPGYRYIEKARPRTTANQQTTLTNHGGVCLFYASFLGAREVTLPTYRSGLEALAVYIHGARRNALFIVLYRPGSSVVTNAFFDDFADVLERTSTFACPLVILGDINIHVDNVDDQDTVKFLTILDSHGLTQHVSSATQSLGHTCSSLALTVVLAT